MAQAFNMEHVRPSGLYSRLLDNLPWKSAEPEARERLKSSGKWADGLCGIASIVIVLAHLAQAFSYDLLSPQDDEDLPPRLFQRPILRLLWQDRIGLTIFAFATGYIYSLKTLEHSHNGDLYGAFSSVAKSVFRLLPRFIIPATIVLIISWAAAQFGAFTVASRSDSWWCRDTVPVVEDSLGLEVIRLLTNFLSTWTSGLMAYDDLQWVLLPLLKASILAYTLVVGTMYVKFRYRLAIYLAMFIYFWQDGYDDVETFYMQAVYGLFLGDLSFNTSFNGFIEHYRWIRRVIAAVFAFSGLIIASYPANNAEWAPWSNNMLESSYWLFPAEVDVASRYAALGVDMLIFALFISPATQNVLSSRFFSWLAKQALAVYLLHGTFLRTVLCWMLYGITGQPWSGEIVDGNGQPIYDYDGNPMHPHWIPIRRGWIPLSIPIWIGMLYLLAWVWTLIVDPLCAMVTRKLETLMFEEHEKPLPLNDMPSPAAYARVG